MVEIFADFVTPEPCRNFNNFYLIRGVIQWWSMRKHILKHTQTTNTFHTKIKLHNYILYYREPSYVGIFLIDLGIPLIFTDFQ